MAAVSGREGRGGPAGWLAWVINLPELVLAVIVAVVTLLVILAVLLRYVFNSPLSWSEEAARVLFMWIGFLGAAVALKRRGHFSVSFLVGRFKPRTRYRLALACTLVAIAMSALIAAVGAKNTATAFSQTLPISGWAVGWLYLAIPVSAALMTAYSLGHLIAQLKTGQELDHGEHADVL